MKKINLVKMLIVLAMVILAAAHAPAQNYETVDMRDYGTAYTATNSQTVGQTIYKAAAVTYAAATTNDIAFYAKIGGVNYKLGTSSVTNGQYDYIDLKPLGIRAGDALVIGTTVTNVTIRLVK